MNDFATHPKVLSEHEIEAMLAGDRRNIDKLMMTQINGLSHSLLHFTQDVFPKHSKNEEDLNRELTNIVKELGDKEELRVRIAYIDAAIAESKARTVMYDKLRNDLASHSLKGLLIVLTALVIYWWNGHAPGKP